MAIKNVLFSVFFLFVSQLLADDSVSLSVGKVYWAKTPTDLHLSIFGEPAKIMYNHPSAVVYAEAPWLVGAKKMGGFICLEVAKQTLYQDIIDSWYITIVGIVPLTTDYKFYRDIQTQSYICGYNVEL